MQNAIKIIVTGNNYLINAGLESLIAGNDNFELVGIVPNENELFRVIPASKADVLILDLSTINYSTDLIASIKKADPYVQILVFNTYQPRYFVAKALENGITSYLMMHCDKDEITQAIQKTTQGERFLCGHIVETLLTSKKADLLPENSQSAYCGGVTISEREMEIIKLIAEGYSNNEIADRLFISVHTVGTHRKNIMSKLGLCNTASLVMYAVREKLVLSE
jgi:DNA-binding NarL/FixJ family response regulator